MQHVYQLNIIFNIYLLHIQSKACKKLHDRTMNSDHQTTLKKKKKKNLEESNHRNKILQHVWLCLQVKLTFKLIIARH